MSKQLTFVILQRMEEIVKKICSHLDSIRMTFSGVNPVENQTIHDWKADLFHSNISTPADDRMNLKKDSAKVSSDYRKAVSEKLQLCP